MSERKTILVRDIMKTKFDMVDGISTVEDAINQMRHVETKCLVVRKRNENDEYGLVMLSDIAREVLAKDKSPSRTNIYEIMSKPVITVHPDMDIRYCARLFARFHLSRAPVVDNGNIVGIVSFTDMILKGLRQK